MIAEKEIYKTYSVQNFRKIPQLAQLSEIDKKAMEIVAAVLPFKANNYVVNELINWKNVPDDPIYTLTFPRKEMLTETHFKAVESALKNNISNQQLQSIIHDIRLELNPHPAGQLNNIPAIGTNLLSGMQHKYRETVLFFPSHGQTCHAYCTFCFRWPQFVGMNEIKFASREIDTLVHYVKNNKSVTDVLFTGGDPMIMKHKYLEMYLLPLLKAEIENLQTIRIGTKSLSYWPYKYTSDPEADDILQLFEKIVASGKNLAIMAHFNHPAELQTSAVQEAISRIRSTGAQIRTQSPLLKHINDSADIWADMWRQQVNQNCIPYYMFVERNTGAQHFFATTLENAWHIFKDAYQQVSGVCRTVRGPSMSANPGKVQILGISEINGKKVFVLRFLQARNPEWVAKPFFAEYNPDAIWLNDLHSAFEKKFFYEEEFETMFANDISETENLE